MYNLINLFSFKEWDNNGLVNNINFVTSLVSYCRFCLGFPLLCFNIVSFDNFFKCLLYTLVLSGLVVWRRWSRDGITGCGGYFRYAWIFVSKYMLWWSVVVMKSKGRIPYLWINDEIPIVQKQKSILLKPHLYVFGSFLNVWFITIGSIMLVHRNSLVISPVFDTNNSFASMKIMNWWSGIFRDLMNMMRYVIIFFEY